MRTHKRFILTKWYLNELLKDYARKIHVAGFILTKWYVNKPKATNLN